MLTDREIKEANHKEVRLRSCPGALVSFSCSNLFTLSPADRRFVLDILETIEKYEEGGANADA